MNRKQKIIVSVVAILIVTLALVGITYAYFLTQIQGNTNTKSIEVSTANLVVDYGEDTNVIQTKTGLIPGNIAVTKTFSATNHGNDEAGYVAILRDVTYKSTKDNSTLTGFERQQDLTYTLTCKQFNESNVETGTCDGVTDTTFPQSTDVSIMVSNKAPVGYTHKYTLTINYLEAGVDQSHDMAKSFSAKVDIEDIKRLNNPYDTGVSTENNKSLAYNIINNAKLNKNGTSLVSSPLTTPGEPSLEDEKELTLTNDDFGMSYYFRGSVTNNYVEFNNMCFRILRIQGDGSIKLILANEGTCANASRGTGVLRNAKNNYLEPNYNTSGIGLYNSTNLNDLKGVTESWFTSNFTDLSQLTQTNWCIDSSINNIDDVYDNIEYNGLSRTIPSNICDFKGINNSTSTLINNYVASSTMDEVVFSGYKSFSNIGTDSLNMYLSQESSGDIVHTITPFAPKYSVSFFSDIDVPEIKVIGFTGISQTGNVRPVIVLKKGVKINTGGIGTKDKPYVINTES